VLGSVYEQDYFTIDIPTAGEASDLVDPESIPKLIVRVEKEMREAASKLDFERAAELRDQVGRLRAWKPGQALHQSELFTSSGARDKITRRNAGKKPRENASGGSGQPFRRPRPKF
jgi:hypothetical protein